MSSIGWQNSVHADRSNCFLLTLCQLVQALINFVSNAFYRRSSYLLKLRVAFDTSSAGTSRWAHSLASVA